MKIEEMAENIVDELDCLENNTTICQKISPSYRDMQIGIIVRCLRHQVNDNHCASCGKPIGTVCQKCQKLLES